MKSHAYKFANHDRVPAKAPDMSLLDKAFGDEPLTREEKNELAKKCATGTYRTAGWAWPLHRAKQVQRILVKFRGYGWTERYAPDKTSFRATGEVGIIEMHYIPKR